MTALELWGGVECTVNRVGDRYRDQVRLSGHHDRVEDLDLFAALGLKAIRYPVLWERTAIDGTLDWTWPDERLARLRTLGIRPIVGLLHHGSGPPHTHLLDDHFAEGLGHYAGEVAKRYDWVEDWTPVNEPVTTARFAALYRHWYPHAADERSFWCALLNQVDATRLAMAAIRRVNPAARLIQTDDLGRTYATDALAHQAEHDNDRRWAGWDLLFGRVHPGHPLFEMLDRMGLGDRLRRIADDPCPPDVVGVNHYLTSDRFLDHRLDRYPAHLHGGNGRETYADTEAVRVLDPGPAGLPNAVQEAWQRYRTPIALTEVHNGSTREEQLRWAAQAWDHAHNLAAKGVDIRGVTAWSLLGSRGWNTLLTDDGIYESGLFDLSSGSPRPTALATLWRDLAEGAPRRPVANEPGWWQRPNRLLYADAPAPSALTGRSGRPLLVCGIANPLGAGFARECTARGITHVAADVALVGGTTPEDIAVILREADPWGVVDATGSACAACASVAGAGTDLLAPACAVAGIPYLALSCDRLPAGADQPRRGRPCRCGVPGAYAAVWRGATVPKPPGLRATAALSFGNAATIGADVVSAEEGVCRTGALNDQYATSPPPWSLVDEALDLLIGAAEPSWTSARAAGFALGEGSAVALAFAR